MIASMIKVARWCAIYGLGVSCALAILNIFNQSYDWSMLIAGIFFSGVVYYYLEYILIPQVDQRERELKAEKAASEQRHKRKRPKLKKKESTEE